MAKMMQILLFGPLMTLLSAPATGQNTIVELSRPKGPSLIEKANTEWNRFGGTRYRVIVINLRLMTLLLSRRSGCRLMKITRYLSLLRA